ncbi:hypothetical protein EV356DRAFT_207612 [Viridothelium virens]|uniref:Uncharacterized protein n=1 Tax=Viridothelium virens TaxID=1048519 RepID=A0A6A6H5H8_VIRVR|nr:hypothetical protein EV356DRAFT_207612 [Viridothelium virens]
MPQLHFKQEIEPFVLDITDPMLGELELPFGTGCLVVGLFTLLTDLLVYGTNKRTLPDDGFLCRVGTLKLNFSLHCDVATLTR